MNSNNSAKSFLINNWMWLLIAIGFLIFAKFFKSLFSGKLFKDPKDEALTDQLETRIKASKPTTGMSKSYDVMYSIAKRIKSAMDGMGTDENAIFNALAGLNRVDLAALRYCFGVQQYGIGPWAEQLDLFGWFENELSDNDLQKAKQIFQSTNLWV